MKIKLIPFLFMLCISIWILPQKTVAQVSVDFQVFYDDLSPYGYWVDNPEYGYVWVPNVARGFSPYSTNGHWIFTDDGWTWVSGYSWGWAPFHYGRWYYDPGYGWLWVPDNEWGPGWVTWRRSDDYYGWAPIGPGISIDVAYSSSYNLPYDRWTFVRNRDFGRSDINNYYVNHSNNVTIINNTTVINNIHVDRTRNGRYNSGPEKADVEKHANRIFAPVAIKESNKPAQHVVNNQLEIYRPQVQRNRDDGSKPAPKKVAPSKEVKPATINNNNNPPQRKEQPVKVQPVQPERKNPPARQGPPLQQKPPMQKTNPPVKQQPVQQPRYNPPVRQQPVQQPRNNPPVRQQPMQQPRNNPPLKQQPVQQPRNNPPVRQQPMQQPVQQPRNNPPVRQEPAKQQPPPKQKKGDGK